VVRASAFWGILHRFRIVIAGVLIAAAYLVFLWILRNSSYRADLLLDTYVQMAGGLIAFTFAANALVRFRGTRDRTSLILAFGFVLAGLIEAGSSLTFSRGVLLNSADGGHISFGWLAGRTILGVLLIAALAVERRIPVSRDPGVEMAGATLIVGAGAYLTSIFYFMLPVAPRIHPDAIIPRPWDLLPAAIYIVATVGYGLRLRRASAALDRALFVAVALNAICHITITESQRMLDAPYMLAHVLMVLSYVVVLGGTLIDNAELFDQVTRLATSDSMTGLANYRQLVEVMENEIQRSLRTGRAFALLLFDLDGLKEINDKYGHVTGSRAIKRVAVALRNSSRSIDTPARYGGDEFAIVLPESGEAEARQAATRICDQLSHDGLKPRIAVSVGLSVFPKDGATIERLLGVADHALYQMKGQNGRKVRLSKTAACY